MLDSRPPAILIADDAPEIRHVLRIALRSYGWVIYEAATPDAAFEIAVRERPDVAVLDVVFTGEEQDGFDLCRRLRAAPATADIPVVMLTARSTAADRDAANSVGATAYLPKPFSVIDLIRTLSSILGVAAHTSPLGVVLLDAGRVAPEELEATLEEQRRLESGGVKVRLGDLLERKGAVSASDVARALQRQHAGGTTPRVGGSLRVLIADDHLAIRDGLRGVLADEDGFEVIGVAADGDAALRLLRERRPDVAILDHEMPGQTGLEVLRSIRRQGLPTNVVFFSLDPSVREEALAAGAASFLSKDASAKELVAAVRAAGRLVPGEDRATLPVARAATHFARRVARQRRAAALMGTLLVAYAGGFLVAEPLLGAGAAVLSIAVVALAGALLGPEAGLLAAALSAALNLGLWQATGHLFGEPVLTVGGNGLGFLALVGVGAGFGAMRLVRGRFDRRSRAIDALIESNAFVSEIDVRGLAVVAEAAREVVSSDALLLYAPASDHGLEVVATAGATASLLGHRERAKFGPIQWVFKAGRGRALGEAEARSFISGVRSGVVVPVRPPGDGAVLGVMVALARRRASLGARDVAALSRFAPAVWLALRAARANQPQRTGPTERSTPPAPTEQ